MKGGGSNRHVSKYLDSDKILPFASILCHNRFETKQSDMIEVKTLYFDLGVLTDILYKPFRSYGCLHRESQSNLTTD